MAVLVLGSVRTIRRLHKGPSLPSPVIRDAVKVAEGNGTRVQLSRLWLDNLTTTTLTGPPWNNDYSSVSISKDTLRQLEQADPQQHVPGRPRQPHIRAAPAAGSQHGPLNGSAVEAVIGAALERINRIDGSVCHDEKVDAVANLLNLQKNMAPLVLVTGLTTNSTYRGNVVRSRRLAFMAAAFERQLERCGSPTSSGSGSAPRFCRDEAVILWDVTDDNQEQLWELDLWRSPEWNRRSVRVLALGRVASDVRAAAEFVVSDR
ncbi:uncharacterized protein MAM_04908 [Metarhizium album ARSEF 1941]|uniref:Uncharacterized protein n=1 Tax=Metarhizium album (strain ARSEF 1941) TaxID=1081103 RepID=A0A0B2WMN4_METAS|nr:uncharacterized protein MAM_04908 [Metarhizium album ARSEF 1941]KHN97311.1 hypothetical protein MAM_04908 [Metarhizium album ARSEF 1941]